MTYATRADQSAVRAAAVGCRFAFPLRNPRQSQRGSRPPVCAPRTCTARFQDNVRVYEHGTMMSRHRSSQIDWMSDAVRREQIGHIFNGEAEHAGQAADGDMSGFDGQSESLDKSS